MRAKTIYIVCARRGDYSDRTEYAVCWFAREADAKACAERMEQKSNEWRSRTADADDPWNLVPQAQADIGDSGWGYFDNTDYHVEPLEHGTTTKDRPNGE